MENDRDAIVRRPLTGDAAEFARTAPWAEAVETPPGARLLFLSGQSPSPVDPEASEDDPRRYGDMEAQTRSTLQNLAAALARSNCTTGDVVKTTAFLVGEARFGGRPDLEGFGRAWREVFGSADQPDLPARSRVIVAGLMHPAWLVEIEAIAARPRP